VTLQWRGRSWTKLGDFGFAQRAITDAVELLRLDDHLAAHDATDFCIDALVALHSEIGEWDEFVQMWQLLLVYRSGLLHRVPPAMAHNLASALADRLVNLGHRLTAFGAEVREIAALEAAFAEGSS
jgi:hypothetical protein